MALTPSTMLPLGTPVPDFRLPDVLSGRIISAAEFQPSSVLVVMFLCNHCPYVVHVRPALAGLARHYQALGVGLVGINSNDVQRYPADSPERMKEEALAAGYTFPYLFDETQDTAKAFRAACTPDFYVFDQQRCLSYRGQMDSSRPGNGTPVTGQDLRAAIDSLLAGRPVSTVQKPSMGCSIKWKPGRAPDYFN